MLKHIDVEAVIWAAIVLVLVGAGVVLRMIGAEHERLGAECFQRGGVLVRSVSDLVCIDKAALR